MKKAFVLAILISGLLTYIARKPLLHEETPGTRNMQASSFVKDQNNLDPEVSTPSPQEPAPKPEAISKEGTIAKRSSFFVEMQKAGIPPAEIERIVRSCRKVFNFKRVKPGQRFTIYSTADGTPDSLYYFINKEKILKVRSVDNNYTASLDTVPYKMIYELTSGDINRSLFASLSSRGANPELAGMLSQIFGWVIDFFKDIRNGDTYAILYEKKLFDDDSAYLGNVLAARITTQGRSYYAFRYKTRSGKIGYYDLNGKSLQKTLLKVPLKFTRITSSFRWKRYHPVTHHYQAHLGVDYAAPYGTPVHATGDGVIIAAQRNKANGNYIKIRHNRSYITYYLHLSRFARGVRRGSRVRQGQVIGYVGATGMATGPHLDYRIKLNGRFVNPRTIKLPSKNPVPPNEIRLFEAQRDAALAKLMEASGKEGKTVVVEKPVFLRSTRMGAAY